MRKAKQWKRLALAVVALIIAATGMETPAARAAVPALDTIRVAMFLHLPGKYTTTTSAATLSSPGGMTIGIRESTGAPLLLQIAESAQLRFAVDDYKAVLLKTASFDQALAAYRHVLTAGGAPYLTAVFTTGGANYQLTEGTYKTAAEATGATVKWTSDATLGLRTGGFKAYAQGPHRLETAPYENRTAAQRAVGAFAGAGLDAYVAVRKGANGQASYSIMVGDAATAEQLKAVQSAAAKVAGGAALKAVELSSSYMLIKQDHSLSGTPNESHELLLFPDNDTKLLISPAAEGAITLRERSNRAYRGQFELSAFGGKLAVVNEAPFEQYLYAVVAVEMYPSWPIEALKAQAVAARTYALSKGLGFQIAHVVDTTLSQAYYGISVERPASTAAVDATRGEVAMYGGKLIEAIYSSSSGGITADASEAWNNSIPYLQPVQSPDHLAEAGLHSWHRVMLPDGRLGYVREDLVKDTGRKTAAGSRILETVADGINARKHPVIQEAVPVLAQLASGTQLAELEKVTESNPMNWTRGPFTAEEMLAAINARLSSPVTGPITSIEIGKKGPSGRVLEVIVNGQTLSVSSPDSLRSVLGAGGSLPSTLFAIEETGKLAIAGAGGSETTRNGSVGSLHVLGANGQKAAIDRGNLFVMDGDGEIRAATGEPMFRFTGTGNGHGVGMSQFGAYGLAQQGHDYRYILNYYYKGITIGKE